MENINKEYLQAAIHLYEYMGYIYCTFDELLDTINKDWEHGYLTEHDGVDGKVYLWYLDIAQMDDNRSVAICVNDNVIISDKNSIARLILGH